MTISFSLMLALAALAGPTTAEPAGDKTCPMPVGQPQDCSDSADGASHCAKESGVIRNPSSQSGQTLRARSNTPPSGRSAEPGDTTISTMDTGATGRTELAIKTKGTGAQREGGLAQGTGKTTDCDDASAS